MDGKVQIIRNFLTEEECFDMIIRYRNRLQQAKTLGHDSSQDKLIRNSKVYIWKDVDLEKKFKCTSMIFQFSEYGVLNHYNWHDDYDTNSHRKRKQTHVINLNKEYRGGEFELEQGIVELDVGDCLRFDSKLKHKVNPVLKGKRYSLTGWEFEEDSPKTLYNYLTNHEQNK